MRVQWVMVADSRRARIFQTEGGLDRLVEVKDLLNPLGRFDDADLRHDAKGRFYGKGERHQANTGDPAVSKVAHAADQFSRDLGQMLALDGDARRYDSLVVVAPPDFLGRLRRNWPERVEQRVTHQLNHEIAHWDGAHIRSYLQQQLALP